MCRVSSPRHHRAPRPADALRPPTRPFASSTHATPPPTGLSSRIAAAKAKAERPEPSDAFLARMASLEREKAAMVARIDALLADKSATESSLIEIRKKALEVEEAMREVEGAASEDISRIKHAMLLYANITNIKWDFSDERRVAGIIAPPEGKSKVFDIDPATSSEFDTCQQLWKLMG